jgi:hypothetical protein
MKSILMSLLLFSCLTSCIVAQKNPCRGRAKSFEYHFKILDSIARITAIDTLSNCQPSIQFMEENTGIEASTDANFFGRFACTKTDLSNWHKWYEENCVKKSKKQNNKIKAQ